MISQMYNGGGTGNALQVAADLDAAIALATQPQSLAVGQNNMLALFLSGIANDKTPVVVAIKHSSSAIALSNIIDIEEDSVSQADMAFSVDRSVWGLAAAVDHEPKRIVYFPVVPNTYVSICLQSAAATTWYTRYRLFNGSAVGRGGGGSAEGDAATEAKQDAILAALDPYGTVEYDYSAAQLADAGNYEIDTAAGASATQHVISVTLSVKQECWGHFQDADDNKVYGPFYLAADATLVLPPRVAGQGRGYWFKNTTNKGLEFSQDSGHAVDYSLAVEFVTAAA